MRQLCCLCSWQLTIGTHGLSLWPGTVKVILRHGQKNHWMELSQLGFRIYCVPCQLLLCCGLRRMSNGMNLALESLHTVSASGTFQGTQVSDTHCPVTDKVDCHEKFYSFTNQAFVSWRLGACQEWWRSLAQSTRSAQWCADTMFFLSLLQSTMLIVAWRNPTLLLAMTTQRS